MTLQSSFTVVTTLASGKIAGLRELLASMNLQPGRVDPDNSLIPFGQFETLHFARIVVLEDQTLDDIMVYGLSRRDYPVYLAFLADFDGDAEIFLRDLVNRAGPGLRRIFAFCDGFTPGDDLLGWMRAHERPSATMYVNWPGRTMLQIRQEAALRHALVTYLRSGAANLAGQSDSQVRQHLRQFVTTEQTSGRLTLTPEPATPFGQKIANALNFVGVGLLILLLLIPIAIVFLVRLRPREKTDPEIAPRPDPDLARRLAEMEDRMVVNQFSAMGSLKPGAARRWVLMYVLWVIDWTARHIFNKGRLGRVRTIHFARWVFLDDKHRLYFASNYDGSLDAYMDDFINKVAFGLNVVFSNGIGYPRTNWLLADGAKDEQKFKYFIRRHELPTEVWYCAHPSLTAVDLERNGRIRQGLEAPSLNDAQAREWVQLL